MEENKLLWWNTICRVLCFIERDTVFLFDISLKDCLSRVKNRIGENIEIIIFKSRKDVDNYLEKVKE